MLGFTVSGNADVGAFSFVTVDEPANSLANGIPAGFIRMHMLSEIKELLKATK